MGGALIFGNSKGAEGAIKEMTVGFSIDVPTNLTHNARMVG